MMRRPLLIMLASTVTVVLIYDLIVAASWWKTQQTHSRRGFTARRYTGSNGEEYGYVLFVPHDPPPGKKLPLILFLNGFGENGTDGVSQISNNFGVAVWETKRNFPMICLAPQCRENWAPDSPDSKRAIAILDRIVEEYDVDTDRIYVTGVSSGGNGAWNLAAAHPDRFAAVVPISSSSALSRETVGEVFAPRRLPIWMFFNDGDQQGLVENTRALRERLLDAGLSPLVTEYHQSHHDAWSAGYRTAAMYEWLSRQSRRNTAELYAASGFRWMLRDTRELNDWEQRGGAEWRITGGVLECINSTGEAGSLLLPAVPGGEFELHFDFRSSNSGNCQVALDSVEVPGDAIHITIDWPERGTGGVLHLPAGNWIGTSIPLAQRALIADRWNDVRIAVRQGQLQVHVNGVLFHQAFDERFAEPRRVSLHVPADETTSRAWRYLRLWTPTAHGGHR